MPKKAMPRIQRIVEPVIKPGAAGFLTKGKELTSAEPGALLLLSGQGFGKDHDRVTVSFGEKETEVLPAPLFGETQILVSVPPLPAGKVLVSAKVDGIASNSIEFEVDWQTVSYSPPGAPVRKFLARCDAFVVLLANEIRVADFGVSVTPEHRDQLIRKALDARKSFHVARERLEQMDEAGDALIHLMEVKDEKAQQKLRRVGKRSAERTLALFDEIVESSQAIRNLDEVNERFRRGESRTAAKILETAAIWAETSLHIAEAMEGAASTAGESVEGGIPAVVGAGAEAIIFTGGPFAAHLASGLALASGIAKGAVELAGNEMGKDFEEVRHKLEKLGSKLDDEVEKDFEKEVKSKLEKLGSKLDKLEGNADKTEGKFDQIEGKLGVLEGKAGKAEGILAKLGAKADKAEGKLDKLEPKVDRLQPKIDKLEPKLDEIRSNQGRSKEFWEFSPETWTVTQAIRAGVRLQDASHPATPKGQAFSVGSIHVLAPGFMIIKLIVDGISTDVTGRNIITPSNVLVDAGISLIGASHSVQMEFGVAYTGPIKFSGEKPHGLDMCTVVEGPDASQNSPNPCTPTRIEEG